MGPGQEIDLHYAIKALDTNSFYVHRFTLTLTLYSPSFQGAETRKMAASKVKMQGLDTWKSRQG
jgi:hypothetical protein